MALSRLAPVTSLAGMAGQGAATGAAQGALTPVDPGQDFWAEKAKQTGVGALVGGIASPLVGRVLSPQTSPEVKTLMDAGITPPPGQVLGGAFKATEEASTSIPLYGEAVKAGQNRAIREFNQALYARTLAPLGPEAAAIGKAAPPGNDGVKLVGDTLSQAYENTLAKIVPSPVDRPFGQAIQNLSAMVPAAKQADFEAVIRRNVIDKMTPAGTITASVFKDAESELGRLARNYKGSLVGDERELGMAYAEAQAQLRDLVARSNPVVQPQIQAINRGWANLTQLETAAARVGAKDGIVSPAQYLSAIKASDKSVRDRAFARGMALNQDFAQAADSVLSKKIADSGTPFRSMVGLAAGGGLGYVNPLAPVAAGTAALGYTPVGQRAFAAALTKRPDWMRLLGDSVPYLTAPAISGLLGP